MSTQTPLTPNHPPFDPWGTVIAIQANYYIVHLDLPGEEPLLCTRRARLKKIGQRVMVGDQVTLEEIDWPSRRAAISHIAPRKTELSRPPIANAEQILLVFSLAEPALDVWQLSRFLVQAESTGLHLCLCLNKSDLLSEEEVQAWQTRLSNWGYTPLIISNQTGRGLPELQDLLNHKITLLVGPSGVGKSSLINRLIPQVQQRVNQVSGKLQKGRHTTRHVELFQLPQGGLLADTPGFNQPDLDLPAHDVIFQFPEVRAQLAQDSCYFKNCLHRGEPHCVISPNWERYEHYLRFLAEIQETSPPANLAGEETTLKRCVGHAGEIYYEPKLESKKYRRHSRRSKHQDLQRLYNHPSEED